ncbi:MAG TPA: sulfotransferase [Thermoanaerobaculia bacterium]|nr:sulfotransferase [Thermoanaerobaculia bacterium]
MSVPAQPPILVTGTHRSGTTWIGRILAADPRVGYIHEPFTLSCRRGVFPYRIPYWYYRVPPPAPEELVASYEDLLRFHYALGAELRTIRSPRDFARMIRDAALFSTYRLQKRRPLVKDPLALLSADWVARTFHSAVIVSIRHPLAFVSSLVRLHWRFDFADLQDQPAAMDLLAAVGAEEDVALGRTLGANDAVVEAAYLWKVLHRAIARYREEHGDWTFVRYEDLARDPVAGFAAILPKVGLAFDDRVRKKLEFLSGESNPDDRSNDPRVTRVASAAHSAKSLTRLSAEDRERVRRIVEPVSALFYSDAEW